MSFNNWCWLAHKAKQTLEKRLDPDSTEIRPLSSGRWRLYGDLGESWRKNETSLGGAAPERRSDWGNSYRAPSTMSGRQLWDTVVGGQLTLTWAAPSERPTSSITSVNTVLGSDSIQV